MAARMNVDKAPPEKPDIHETAIAWWVKCDAGPLSPGDANAFEAWLAADPGNQAAFDEVASLCGDVRALRPEHSAAPKPPAARRRRLVLLSGFAAASLVLCLSFDEASLLWRADFRTATGETRSVDLEDGSRVELGAKSAIAVDFSGAQRKLTLLEGEAWFAVAPSTARPFVVAAAGGTVTALGTAFDIALERAGAVVTVTKHRVAIESRGQTELIGEGQQSEFGPDMRLTAPVSVDTGDATAWRRGKLIFVNRPLGEVVAILSRYHHGYFVIPRAAVRELRVTGVFDGGDPLGVVRGMETSLDIHATTLTDYLVILHE